MFYMADLHVISCVQSDVPFSGKMNYNVCIDGLFSQQENLDVLCNNEFVNLFRYGI